MKKCFVLISFGYGSVRYDWLERIESAGSGSSTEEKVKHCFTCPYGLPPVRAFLFLLMSSWESIGKTDEWYTPKYIFDALGCRFDLDVAAPNDRKFVSVPADQFITENSLDMEWSGFIWCNPPFGGRNGIVPWLRKSSKQGNGIFLSPDRTSAPWWHEAALLADAVLFIKGKVKFIRADGAIGSAPSVGTSLFGYGDYAVDRLCFAEKNGLGKTFKR